MDTILKKKGRIAMAWVVIVTMIFATLYTPFAYAVDSTTYPSGNTFSNFQKVDKANITSTTVPADADFIFIKQASEKQGEHYLWTPVQITDDQLKKDILQYVKDNDPSMGNNPQYDAEFWANFDNFIWGYDDDVDKFNVSPYGFTKQEIEGKYYTVIEWTALSHIDFGYYEEEEVTPGSVQIQATKTFEDYEFEGNDFEFGLFEATMEDDEWVAGATPIQKAYNDINGLIKFSPIEFGEDDVDVDHYYIIKELGLGPDNNTEDVDFDNEPIKVIVKITLDDNEVVATADFVGDKESFTNTYEDEETGSIPVNKTIVTSDNEPFDTNKEFLVGLFDENGKMYDKEPLTLIVKSGTFTSDTKAFTELDLTKVYNVFEVYKADGKYYKVETIGGKVNPIGIVPWESIAYTNNLDIDAADFDGDDNLAPTVTITNTYPGEEGGLLGAITVVKKVTVNKKAFNSNLTFHVGLFDSEDMTTPIDMKDLVMGGKSEVSVSFEELDAGTYYIAETDASGKPLAGTAKELGFEITVDGNDENLATVELIGDDVTVELVNNFKKEEFPLTGDNSNMNLWIFLAMLGVAGAIAPFAFRKKEEAND